MGKKNKQKKRKRSSLSSGDEGDNKGKTAIDKQNPSKKNPTDTSKTTSSKVTVSTPTNTAAKYVGNPLLEQQAKFLNQTGLTDRERYEFFSPDISGERRAELWMAQADLGEKLVNHYAWATPDATAIRILKEFSPLIEIGCGSNAYWCHVLQQHGIDIIAYDVDVSGGGQIGRGDSDKKTGSKKSKKDAPSFLHQGGPEVLASKEIQRSGRTLFLCYPDEEDYDDKDPGGDDDNDDNGTTMPTSMGWQCLHHYTGQYVIHVGETFLDANLGIEQAPWGRSSSPEFQQRLACEYHCLLKVELPNWFHTRDTITVWKRSMISTMVFAADDDDDDDDQKEEDEDDEDEVEEDEEVEYRHIPRNERLPTNLAAPCLAHLLPNNTDHDETALPSPPNKLQANSATKSKPDPSKSPKSSISSTVKKETTDRPTTSSDSPSNNPPSKSSKTNSYNGSQEKKKHRNKNRPQQLSEQGSTTTPSTAVSKTKNDKNKDTWAEMERVSDVPQRQKNKKYVTPW